MELVKLSDPTNTKGVYPSDCAYKRDDAGKLIPRGKTAYGDGVLEYVGENAFKVLATEEIVRRKAAPAKAVAPALVPKVPVPAPVAAPAKAEKKGKKKASTSASKPPSAARSAMADRQQSAH